MSFSKNDFNYFRELVLERSAIVLEDGKEYLVESRTGQVIETEGFETINHLAESLRKNSNNGLQSKVIEALTTNETSFLRDIHAFETLKDAVLPELLKTARTRETSISGVRPVPAARNLIPSPC